MFFDIQKSLIESLNTHDVRDCRVIVACSAGVDSTVLLHMVNSVADDRSIDVVVAHLNHKLRGIEADDDERFVVGLADKWGLECKTTSVDVGALAKMEGEGIESAARKARYEFLEGEAESCNAPFVLVAHSADDAAETLVMNLARGSGLDGLSSHAMVRQLGSALIVRPLLNISRAQIEEYAKVNELQWREDSSNEDLSFVRNSVRKNVIPMLRETFGPDVTHRLTTSASLLRDAKKVKDALLKPILSECISVSSSLVLLSVEKVLGQVEAVQSEIIRAAIELATKKTVSYPDTISVLRLIGAQTGSVATIRGGFSALRDREVIRIERVPEQADETTVVINDDGSYFAGSQKLEVITESFSDSSVDLSQEVACIDSACIKGPLEWRTWRDGDRFRPFGMDGSILVSDLLTNSHVPHSRRRSVRVVSDDEGILWVCGYRQAERTRVGTNTEQIVSCRLELFTE